MRVFLLKRTFWHMIKEYGKVFLYKAIGSDLKEYYKELQKFIVIIAVKWMQHSNSFAFHTNILLGYLEFITVLKSTKLHYTIIRAAFVHLFVPLLSEVLWRIFAQTWGVYVGGPRNCPWGVLFWKGQRVNGSNVTFLEQTTPGWDHTAAKACPAKGTRRLRV